MSNMKCFKAIAARATVEYPRAEYFTIQLRCSTDFFKNNKQCGAVGRQANSHYVLGTETEDKMGTKIVRNHIIYNLTQHY